MGWYEFQKKKNFELKDRIGYVLWLFFLKKKSILNNSTCKLIKGVRCGYP